MRVKAKKSYQDLDNSENYHAFGSPSKHYRLLNGEIIEINAIPDGLKKHLSVIKKKESK